MSNFSLKNLQCISFVKATIQQDSKLNNLESKKGSNSIGQMSRPYCKLSTSSTSLSYPIFRLKNNS